MKLAVGFLTAITCGSVRIQQSGDTKTPVSTSEISVWNTDTTTTATTTLEPEKVEIKLSVAGITPEDLENNPGVKASLTLSMQDTISTLAGVPKDWVEIAFGGASSFTAITHLKKKAGLIVAATITIPTTPEQSGDSGATVAINTASINDKLTKVDDIASQITEKVKTTPGVLDVASGTISVSEPEIVVVTTTKTTTTKGTTSTSGDKDPPVDVSSYGDPHCKNLHGQRFDIQRPGNHSFLVLPRGADHGRANLYVEARVTRRGGLCAGQLFVTGLKLAGRWIRALGGDVELYAATEMFNSPEVVGLKLGNSSNMSLEEFVARVPKHTLEVSQFRPELPAKLNTHVNTLRLQFKVGPSTVKVGWAHEKLTDGFANWLWLGVSGFGSTDEAGGLLGSDDHSAVQKAPQDVLAACQENPGTAKPRVFRSWVSAEA